MSKFEIIPSEKKEEAKKIQINYEAVFQNILDHVNYKDSEMIPIQGEKEFPKQYPYEAIYKIKEKDPSKQRFAKDCYISKQYEKAILNNLSVLQKFLR